MEDRIFQLHMLYAVPGSPLLGVADEVMVMDSRNPEGKVTGPCHGSSGDR